MGALLLLSGCGVSSRADDAVAFPRWTATGFEDSFSGPAGTAPDGSRWTLERGGWGWGNTELQCFTADPSNVSLDGQGHLRIVARKQGVACADGRSNQYTSARLTTAGTYSFHYGRIEVRAKLPGGRGLLPVIWALGDDFDRVGWPASGEIDVAEVLGSDPSTVYGTLHGPGADAPWQLQNRHQAGLPLNEGFHVYAAEWGPDGVRFLLDGRQYGRALSLTDPDLPAGARWPFDKPFHLLMSLSVGNVWEGPPNSDEVFPAEMLIDWVRVLRP
jgi:beta-glucanase (GH16 family)